MFSHFLCKHRWNCNERRAFVKTVQLPCNGEKILRNFIFETTKRGRGMMNCQKSKFRGLTFIIRFRYRSSRRSNCRRRRSPKYLTRWYWPARNTRRSVVKAPCSKGAKYFFGLAANCWRDHPLCQQCTSAAYVARTEKENRKFFSLTREREREREPSSPSLCLFTILLKIESIDKFTGRTWLIGLRAISYAIFV